MVFSDIVNFTYVAFLPTAIIPNLPHFVKRLLPKAAEILDKNPF